MIVSLLGSNYNDQIVAASTSLRQLKTKCDQWTTHGPNLRANEQEAVNLFNSVSNPPDSSSISDLEAYLQLLNQTIPSLHGNLAGRSVYLDVLPQAQAGIDQDTQKIAE